MGTSVFASMPTIDEKQHYQMRDIKARRRLNTSEEVANITAKDIEEGNITLEQLQNLNVPIYLYNGQITIHGTLPDVDAGIDKLGYKSIFRNGNGTLGVRYAAIDSAKKQELKKAIFLSPIKEKWGVQVSSKGYTVMKCIGDDSIENRQKLRECKNKIPDFLYGSSYGVKDPWTGRIYLVMEINAIPQENMSDVMFYFAGITKDEYEQLEQLEQRKKEEKEKAYDERKRKEKELREEMLNQFKKMVSAKEVELKIESGYKGYGRYFMMTMNSNKEISSGESSFNKSSFGRTEFKYGDKQRILQKKELESFVNQPFRAFLYLG